MLNEMKIKTQHVNICGMLLRHYFGETGSTKQSIRDMQILVMNNHTLKYKI